MFSYHEMMSSQVCMIANRDFEKLAVIGRLEVLVYITLLHRRARTPKADVGGGGGKIFAMIKFL